MAGCCVLGGQGWTSWTSSSPLGSSSSSSSSPHPPQQKSVGQRHAREEEGMVAIALASPQHHCHVWKGGGSKQEDVFMVVIVDDLSENSVFL
jgi:hypothetical protein